MKFPVLMLGALVLLLSANGAQAVCFEDDTTHACGGVSGNPGGKGEDISGQVPEATTGSYAVQSAGGTGTGSDTASGGDGGEVELTVQDGKALDSFLLAQSLGGTGNGNGGDGGTVTVTMQEGSSANAVSVSSDGGKTLGVGQAGDGGTVTATLAGTVATDTTISSNGGDAEQEGGAGGNSGAVTVVVTSTGHLNSLQIISTGGEDAEDLPLGSAGAIDVAIAGEVGSARLVSKGVQDGTVSVVLEDGAVVTGAISVEGNNNATLTFDMQMTNRREYNAALEVLLDPTKPASGSIIVNGRTYAWTGFDQLVNMLAYVGTTQPSAPAKVVVTRPGIAKAPPPAGAFKCSSVAVHPVVQADGSIALYANAGGSRGKSLIGVMKDGKFRSSGLDFSVVADGGAYTVIDAAGSTIAKCSA